MKKLRQCPISQFFDYVSPGVTGFDFMADPGSCLARE